MQYQIQHFDTLDSTNQEAMRQAMNGAHEGLVVVAKTQTAGKGRLGRTWHTINQALAMTILLRPNIQARDVPKMSLLAAVAAHEALSFFVPEVGIKWPNDLLIHGKKVSGILTEMHCDKTNVKAVAIGLGINISRPETMWPKDIQQAATDLSTAAGKIIHKEDVLTAVLESLDVWYSRFLQEGFFSIHQAWWNAHIASGEKVRVFDGNGYIEGIAMALAKDGALCLLVNGKEQRIIAGDVSLMDK